MADEKKTERLEGSLTDGGSLPGDDDEDRSFGGGREAEGEGEAARLPAEKDASTQRGRDLPDGGYEPPAPEPPARGYGG